MSKPVFFYMLKYCSSLSHCKTVMKASNASHAELTELTINSIGMDARIEPYKIMLSQFQYDFK